MLYRLNKARPKIINRHHTMFYVVDLVDNNKKIKYRKIYQTKEKLKEITDLAISEKLNLLYRGIYLLKRKEIKHITINKKIVELPARRRILDNIFIDIDNDNFETIIKIKKFVKYIKKIGIDPSVFKTNRGYHIYISFINPFITIKNRKLFFAKSIMVQDIIKGLSRILKDKIKIDYDIISSMYSVWYEGYPQPIKNNKKTKLIFSGAYHDPVKVRQYLNKHIIISKNKKQKLYFENKPNLENNKHIIIDNASSLIGVLRKNYHYAFYLIDNNYCAKKAYEVFKSSIENLDYKTFHSFYSYCMNVDRKMNIKRTFPKKQKKSKNNRIKKHYYEYIDVIVDKYLDRAIDESMSVRKISSITGIPRSSLHEILKVASLSDIIKNPKLIKSILIRKDKNKIYKQKITDKYGMLWKIHNKNKKSAEDCFTVSLWKQYMNIGSFVSDNTPYADSTSKEKNQPHLPLCGGVAGRSISNLGGGKRYVNLSFESHAYLYIRIQKAAHLSKKYILLSKKSESFIDNNNKQDYFMKKLFSKIKNMLSTILLELSREQISLYEYMQKVRVYNSKYLFYLINKNKKLIFTSNIKITRNYMYSNMKHNMTNNKTYTDIENRVKFFRKIIRISDVEKIIKSENRNSVFVFETNKSKIGCLESCM